MQQYRDEYILTSQIKQHEIPQKSVLITVPALTPFCKFKTFDVFK